MLPERRWLTDPAVREQVRELLNSTRPRFDEFHETKAGLRYHYKEEFFQLDLHTLEQRFAGPYRSWLRFFSTQFRKDCKGKDNDLRVLDQGDYPVVTPAQVRVAIGVKSKSHFHRCSSIRSCSAIT